MDPFSITASALGLLSSITSLSFKLNELRQDFTEAEKEIDELNRELALLSAALEELRGTRIMLPGHYSAATLAKVLDECDRLLIKAEAHLRKESRRSFRRAHWAVSGRREHMSICRGIESYKLTLTMTIILATVPQASRDQASHQLDEVEGILERVQFNTTLFELNPMLQIYLNDLESCAETIRGTTIAPAEYVRPREPSFDSGPESSDVQVKYDDSHQYLEQMPPNREPGPAPDAQIRRVMSTNRTDLARFSEAWAAGTIDVKTIARLESEEALKVHFFRISPNLQRAAIRWSTYSHQYVSEVNFGVPGRSFPLGRSNAVVRFLRSDVITIWYDDNMTLRILAQSQDKFRRDLLHTHIPGQKATSSVKMLTVGITRVYLDRFSKTLFGQSEEMLYRLEFDAHSSLLKGRHPVFNLTILSDAFESFSAIRFVLKTTHESLIVVTTKAHVVCIDVVQQSIFRSWSLSELRSASSRDFQRLYFAWFLPQASRLLVVFKDPLLLALLDTTAQPRLIASFPFERLRGTSPDGSLFLKAGKEGLSFVETLTGKVVASVAKDFWDARSVGNNIFWLEDNNQGRSWKIKEASWP